jgi:hypothetical protein
MKIDKDLNLLAEAYDKVRGLGVSSAGAKGKISPKEFEAVKDRLRAGLNKLAINRFSSDIDDVVYTLTQYPTFSQEAKLLKDELEDELSSIRNDIELRANWKKISQLGTDLLNASIWSFGESVEETSSSKLTVESLIKAIETSLQPFRFECEVCYLGQVMDVLEKMGFKLFGAAGPDREAFNGIWKKFLSENAYCYDMSATDSYDMDEETPRFSENKIDKNGPGEYLFMEGSGRGPDVYLASEFASKHGYKKLILNGLS